MAVGVFNLMIYSNMLQRWRLENLIMQSHNTADHEARTFLGLSVIFFFFRFCFEVQNDIVLFLSGR